MKAESSTTGGGVPFCLLDEDISGARCQPAQILYIDDDIPMQQMLGNYLEEQKLRVVLGSRRQDVVRQFAVRAPDLVILDLELGQEDGLDLLREIRSQSDVPVIIFTGRRCDEVDRVVGLELGADDYITKPFGLREVLARIRAVLRRHRVARVVVERNAERGRFRFGSWQLDRRIRQLTDANGEAVALTKGEYALLVAFLSAPQRPLTRGHLLQVTRVHEDVSDRSIALQVMRLRRKLETDPCMPRVIRTERGIGYIFALPVEQL
jgi:two-component system, OmpR family, response regulator